MIDRITFSVDRKIIRIYGQEFTLGELSVQILNTPSCRIQEMNDLLRKGRALAQQYEDIGDYALWFQANDCYFEAFPLISWHLSQILAAMQAAQGIFFLNFADM